jgi:hypothetical protein
LRHYFAFRVRMFGSDGKNRANASLNCARR